MKKRIALFSYFLLLSMVAFAQSEEKKPSGSVAISGRVLHLDTESPMSVKLFVYNLTNNKEVASTISDPTTGEYSLTLPYGMHYGIGAHLDDFLPIFEELHLVETLDIHEVEKNVYVAPLKKGETIPLTNVHFSDNGKKILPMSFMALDELANVMERHAKMKIEVKGLEHFGKAGHTEEHALKSAKAIAKYLYQKGIAKDRVTYGIIPKADLHVPSDFQEIFEVELMIREI